LIPAVSFANPQEEVNRALIERDQRTAEFAAGVNGADRRGLEILHQRQLFEARPLQPYHREQMAREREGFLLRLPPPERRSGSDPELKKPLPLPGGPRHGVEPIPADRVDG